jgi:hypothetical protein
LQGIVARDLGSALDQVDLGIRADVDGPTPRYIYGVVQLQGDALGRGVWREEPHQTLPFHAHQGGFTPSASERHAALGGLDASRIEANAPVMQMLERTVCRAYRQVTTQPRRGAWKKQLVLIDGHG